jgi:thiol-disulfide isomerase/thioredoxin
MNTALTTTKPQQCTLSSLYASWLAYPLGIGFFAVTGNWLGGLLWVLFVPGLRWSYVKLFPYLSSLKQYGNVEDKLPVQFNRAPVKVTFYSFLSCPFCPIVLARLEALQKEMGFYLEKLDVTFQPQILSHMGIRSVPVVEVGIRHLVGNATSEQLAEFIAQPFPAMRQAS